MLLFKLKALPPQGMPSSGAQHPEVQPESFTSPGAQHPEVQPPELEAFSSPPIPNICLIQFHTGMIKISTSGHIALSGMQQGPRQIGILFLSSKATSRSRSFYFFTSYFTYKSENTPDTKISISITYVL
jgi:hypothetical protein